MRDPSDDDKSVELLPQAEPMAIQDIREALVIRERDMFLVMDVQGQITRGNPNGHGLYHRDMRYLSGYELSFTNARPLVLLATAELGYSSEEVMINPEMIDGRGKRLPRGSVHLQRTRVIDAVLEETLTLRNHNVFPVLVEIRYRFAADFADIFEVRGYEAERRGTPEEPIIGDGILTMRHAGADGHRRETSIVFDPAPDSLVGDPDLTVAAYAIELEPQAQATVRLAVCVDGRLEAPASGHRFAEVAQRHAEWKASTTEVTTDNEFFNQILARSLDDIRMLWTEETPALRFAAAGSPWYDCLFGRDSCITGMQTLAFRTETARESLSTLAKFQGTKLDNWRDEEPGKILHELRRGELTNSNELPFSPYYGSIDSTPLFILLAGEYYRWTADGDLVDALSPNVDAALAWLKASGDANGDGYIDYEKRSAKGLVNQGWKDSADSMLHKDGTLIPPPIALSEVQAYAYAGLRRLAEMGGVPETLAQADELKRRFNNDFWMEDEGTYALALDGNGQRAESIASNAGHALWCGIAEPQMARRVAARLMSPDMFSGWGIRTLSALSPRFNPQGYHLGTVWPHDNSIIAMGFKRYGLEPEFNALLGALFEAARLFEYYRLPELFAGGQMSGHHTPVPYPVACRPQAWAAGAFPLMTQAMLGLAPDAANGRLYVVNPVLPPFIGQVHVKRLRVGDAEVDLRYERQGRRTTALVEDVRGHLKVLPVDEWPKQLL